LYYVTARGTPRAHDTISCSFLSTSVGMSVSIYMYRIYVLSVHVQNCTYTPTCMFTSTCTVYIRVLCVRILSKCVLSVNVLCVYVLNVHVVHLRQLYVRIRRVLRVHVLIIRVLLFHSVTTFDSFKGKFVLFRNG
jgi:hypothetical protein